jgi:hypothetical protein
MASDPKAKKPVKPFAQAKKGSKGVTSKQAELLANLLKFHKDHVAPMVDAEDLKDGGADEDQEQE